MVYFYPMQVTQTENPISSKQHKKYHAFNLLLPTPVPLIIPSGKLGTGGA